MSDSGPTQWWRKKRQGQNLAFLTMEQDLNMAPGLMKPVHTEVLFSMKNMALLGKGNGSFPVNKVRSDES